MVFNIGLGKYSEVLFLEISFGMVNPVVCIQKYNRNNILHMPLYKYTILGNLIQTIYKFHIYGSIYFNIKYFIEALVFYVINVCKRLLEVRN